MITHTFDPIVRQLRKNARDFSAPLKQWYVYMLSQTARTFRALGKKNAGAYRGVSWPWFAPIRTTRDGKRITVPAEGDGITLGKMRHSGKRVTAGSRLLQDKGLLRNAAIGRMTISPFSLAADTPVKYAADMQKMRPFVFITEADGEKLTKMINSHLLS